MFSDWSPSYIPQLSLRRAKLFCTVFSFFSLVFYTLPSYGQYEEIDIKIYDFDEGLSHRNVFNIQQDSTGYIWLATINGLNRFDGYSFIKYDSRSTTNPLPFDAISDMHIDPSNRICLANPDYLTFLYPETNQVDTVRIKTGAIVRRESLVPYNLTMDERGDMWFSAFDEKSARTTIYKMDKEGLVEEVTKAKGSYQKRPIAAFDGKMFVGAYENEVWEFDTDGKRLNTYEFPLSKTSRDQTRSRVVQMQLARGRLWALLADGHLYYLEKSGGRFIPHPINVVLPKGGLCSALLVEENGNLWIGGQSILWHYDATAELLIDYSTRIQQSLKNLASFRQIFRDHSGVVWIASDFGAIKITPSDHLFNQYLSGGNENCSNVLCSTRGITEDDRGNIYISYYNSIHIFEPNRNAVRPLFPFRDYFNFPFGITYFDGSLFTGNGLKIDLETLQIDTVLNENSSDLGAIIADQEDRIWFGYEDKMLLYFPDDDLLIPFEDRYGFWKATDGTISYLHEGQESDYIWVATSNNGVYGVDKSAGREVHYSAEESSPVLLSSNQINAVYEDTLGYLWLATAVGLHRIELQTNDLRVYTTEDGLPNNFINGILSEGDSCIWASTDDGLCRFSLGKEKCLNFFQRDGLSANEFNRMSFYKATDGRMYFGGLNGINAFYPGKQFLEKKVQRKDTPMMFTSLSKFDGKEDHLSVQNYGLSANESLHFSYLDKFFTFNFALADYRQPLQNLYSYKLEPYEKEWSVATPSNLVRYNNVPAGEYTFRVRSKVGKGDWNPEELGIKVQVEEAYYRTWWFLTLMLGLFLGGTYGFIRYRVYSLKKREADLEMLVKERTQELEEEKHKSEELLLNILPAETAEELKKFGVSKAKRHEFVTVMFSDFKGFSKIAEQMDPEELVAEIDFCFRAFDQIMDRHGLEKIKTIGDAYMCVGGISDKDSAEEANAVVKAALEIQEFMASIAIERKLHDEHYFEARIGIHTGPVVAGIVGIKKFAYDIWGDTVNIASRMETYGEAGKVNISEFTHKLIQDEYNFSDHGKYTENNGEDIEMYFVDSMK